MRHWSVLAGCFIGMSVATPAILMIPLGLYLKSVTLEFGWTRTEFSTILSLAALCNAVVLPLAGFLVDRLGPPRIILIGTILGGGAYASLSQAHSYGAFVGTMALSVAGGNLASYPAFMGLAQRWFDRRLGLALAITSTGLAAGVGGFSYLITTTIASDGWRMAFLTVGLLAMAIGLGNLLVLVRDNRGEMPEVERNLSTDTVTNDGMSLGQALRSTEFWLYALSFTLVVFAVVGCNFHLPALLSDRGASTAQIAAIVGIGSAGSLFGRFCGGVMLDRFSPRLVGALFFGGQAIGFVLLLDGLRWALPAGFLLGAVQGAEIDLMGYVIARRFGRVAYARIFGTCFALTLIGAMVGPVALAMVYDRTEGYGAGLALFPLFPVLAFAFLCLATRPSLRTGKGAFCPAP